MRIFLFAGHITFLVLAAILIFGSIGGFLGGAPMIISAVVVILAWGLFAGLTIYAVKLAYAEDTDAVKWANGLFLTVMILSPLTGLGLAILSFVGCGPLYVPPLYHWAGLAGTILGFAAYFLLPLVGDGNPEAHDWKTVVFAPLGVFMFWGLAWLIGFLILKGDINVKEYPTGTGNKYLLPYAGGEGSWVIQGNNSGLDHNDSHFGQKFSWDFVRRCGTPVLASRAGTVSSFTDTNDGFGGTSHPYNQIVVDHGDKTFAYYLHIQQGSVPKAFRTARAPVKQGDTIALAGCVGNSFTGHIHFMVRPDANNNNPTIAVVFGDVSDDNGIPRTFGSYTSKNRVVP